MVNIYFFTENLLSDFMSQRKAEKGRDREGGRDMDGSWHRAKQDNREKDQEKRESEKETGKRRQKDTRSET